jgi:hypothetical protein
MPRILHSLREAGLPEHSRAVASSPVPSAEKFSKIREHVRPTGVERELVRAVGGESSGASTEEVKAPLRK